MKRIYLDYAATTPLDKKVLEKMLPYFSEEFGNPSSIYERGMRARESVEEARKKILKTLNTRDHRLIFTSGGTEANNLALKGLNQNKNHIISTKIEHDSILSPLKSLAKKGKEVSYLSVDREGFVDLEMLEKEIKKETLLVSVIEGNNEIGTLQDIKEIAKIVHDNNSLLHVDACQSFRKTNLNLKHIDLLSINSHKIYGPKGIGGLAVREGLKLNPEMEGGGQEYNLRSGTLNVPSIVGFGESVDVISESDREHMSSLRDYLIKELTNIEECWVNGALGSKRLCNNVNITFRYVEGESLLLLLDHKGIEISTGSACSSKSLEPSHVLRALGLKQEDTHGSIRLSLGKETTKEECKYVVEAITESVEHLRNISPFRA